MSCRNMKNKSKVRGQNGTEWGYSEDLDKVPKESL